MDRIGGPLTYMIGSLVVGPGPCVFMALASHEPKDFADYAAAFFIPLYGVISGIVY